LGIRHSFSDPELRREVSEPLGDLVSEEEAIRLARQARGIVITIGDVVSRSLLQKGIRPKLVVFDERTRRRRYARFPRHLISDYCLRKVVNPAGTISSEAYEELKRLISLSGQSAVKILGEEDLLGLLAIEFAPVGSLVFYGQPDMGIIAVKVDKESKATACSVLHRSRVAKDGC
jgi:uncharacterized protein (UPF0218 family)